MSSLRVEIVLLKLSIIWSFSLKSD